MKKTVKRKQDYAKNRKHKAHVSSLPGQSSHDIYKREEHFKISPKHPGKGRS